MCYNTLDLIKRGGGTDPEKPGNLGFYPVMNRE